MLQPEIAGFLVTKDKSSHDVRKQNPEKESIFECRLKKRKIEGVSASSVAQQNVGASSDTQPTACKNVQCVSDSWSAKKNINLTLSVFQLADKKELVDKHDALKVKLAKLRLILKDYQIKIGDLNHKLEQKQKQTAKLPVESVSEVTLFDRQLIFPFDIFAL